MLTLYIKVEVKKEVTSQEEDSGNEDMEGEVTEEKEDKEEGRA